MLKSKFLGLFSFILFLTGWQLLVQIQHYPSFLLPSPVDIFWRFMAVLNNGLLLQHALITLQEIFWGLLIGFSSAFILGYFLAKSRTGEHLLSPILVSFQAVPIIALAPLLVIWFGTGILAKSLVCATTLFFPVLISSIAGFRQIDNNLVDLMYSLQANFWQKLILLDVPASLPILFASLKIGVTLSVIGAVVGEFVGANRGLGFLINLAGGLYDTPLRFVAFLALSLIALCLYGLVDLLEKKLIIWQN